MKKILFTVILMLVGMQIFAYEPKPEYFTYKNNKVIYEEIIKYENKWITPTEYRFTYNVKTKKFIWEKSESFKLMWYYLEEYRKGYKRSEYLASVYPEHSNAIQNFLKKYGNNQNLEGMNEAIGELTGEKYIDDFSSASFQRSSMIGYKNKALMLPFITEDNWQTITQEEYKKLLQDYFN